ncbi:hypothetical protein DFH09DRAFT_1253104 [Mycena vulgaris]|nr:hypothetical protein DFH09DRAFT_1253104 [Mycena vulgaris]
MLRGEGRGAAELHEKCGECRVDAPLFRCAHQTCFGPAMYCEKCISTLHRQLPTHMVEKWTRKFFSPMTLDELTVETRFQLGHRPGRGCPKAWSAHKDFVLMRACLWLATSLDPQTCATFNVIRLFEVQNCLGKISAYNFVRSLEFLSNNDGLKPTLNCQRAFRAIIRQYQMMQMQKRAGRGHDNTGVQGTKQGELVLRCCACPQPGINLPEGWDKINWDVMGEDQRYKYFERLSEDANFKLINRNVSSEAHNPIIGNGTGYFCNRADYSGHVHQHVGKEEISSCSGFQAMFLPNAKRVKDLCVMGVGGVTCAHHNMWRPNSLGDLQVGERHCNMDFLFFSAVLNFSLMYLILSYNVVCQFSKNIWTRMLGVPEKYHLKVDTANVRCMVPHFHLPGHKKGWCTHGKTVEQN